LTEQREGRSISPWFGWLTLALGVAVLCGAGLFSWPVVLGLAIVGVLTGAICLAGVVAAGGRGAGAGVTGLVFVAVGSVASVLLPILLGTGPQYAYGDPPSTPPAATNPPAPISPTPTMRPGPLVPVQAVASSTSPDSTDAAGNPVGYGARNLIDRDPTTAWRSAGSTVPVTIRLTFDRPVHLTRIDLIPGYAKVDSFDGTDRFAQNSRVATASFALDDGYRTTRRFSDRPEPQGFNLADDTTSVVVTVLAAVTGQRPNIAISEVLLTGWEK
jgi:hypothetical protein